MENVITLGKLSPVVFILSPLLSILFLKTPKNTRNELARPVMGTIFLVSLHRCRKVVKIEFAVLGGSIKPSSI